MRLRPSVCLENDSVFRCGDLADEMYLLDKGHLNVLLPKSTKQTEKDLPNTKQQHSKLRGPVLNGSGKKWVSDDDTVEYKKVAVLASGAYFGEIALFSLESTRTATIKAAVDRSVVVLVSLGLSCGCN